MSSVSQSGRGLARAVALGCLVMACGQGKKAPASKADESAAAPQASAGSLPADPAAPLALNPKVKTGVMPNGLTYFVLENKEPEKRADFWLVVNAGSFHEDDDQQGLAHFVEHMAFNGTVSFPKNELLSKLQKLGVKFGPHINAYTSFDETVYKLRVPTDDPEAIKLTLAILSDWAQGVTFLPDDVDAERGVVLSEKRDGQGPETRLLETLIAELFKGTQYAQRLPIGKPEILKSASAETLKRFYRDWYHPGNMAVLAVGDFDTTQMEAKLTAQFAGLKSQPQPRPQPVRSAPERTEPLVLAVKDKELPLSAVIVGRLLEAQKRASMNDFRRDFIVGVAAVMLSKRLEEAQKKGTARYLMAAGGPVPLVRAAEGLGFLAAVKPDQMREGLEDVVGEVERARRHGFVGSEFDRAKKELISRLENSAKEAAANKEDSEELIDELVRHFLTGEAVPGVPAELAMAQHFAKTVSIDEINRALDGLLSAKDLVVVSAAPEGASVLSQDDATSVLAAVPGRQLVAYADEKSDQPLIDPLPAPGAVASQKHHSDADVHEWTLTNGARVMLKPTKFKEDEVLLYAGSPGGTSLLSIDDLRKTYMTGVTARLGGLGNFDATALEKALAGRRVSVNAHVNEYQEGLSGSAGVADMETLFQLVHLSFQKPRVDKRAFDVWKESFVQNLRLANNKPEVRFFRKLLSLQTNNDPRALDMTEELVNTFDLERSTAFYKERFADASDFTFVLVGNFELATVKPLVERYLGSLPDIERQETAQVHKWPTHKAAKRMSVRDGDTQRAQLQLAFSREIAADQVALKQRLAWELFGAALELKFLEIFREQLGDAYNVNVHTGFANMWHYASMNVGLQVDPKRAAELEKRLLAEIKAAVDSGVGSEYLAKAKQAALKDLETGLKNNEYWRDLVFDTFYYGRTHSEITGRKAAYEQLTDDDVAAIAKILIDPTKPVVGVLLPKAR